MTPTVELTLVENQFKVANQNELQIDLKMNLKVTDIHNKEIPMIQRIEESEEELFSYPSLVIYYVKEGDSLWSIAKKYHTTVESLKELNELKEDLIYPGEPLLIAKYRVPEESTSLG